MRDTKNIQEISSSSLSNLVMNKTLHRRTMAEDVNVDLHIHLSPLQCQMLLCKQNCATSSICSHKKSVIILSRKIIYSWKKMAWQAMPWKKINMSLITFRIITKTQSYPRLWGSGMSLVIFSASPWTFISNDTFLLSFLPTPPTHKFNLIVFSRLHVPPPVNT